MPAKAVQHLMIVGSGRSARRREAQGSGDAGMAGQGQTSQGLFPPGREPNSRSGAVTTVTPAFQVAAQVGYVRVSKAARITEGYLYRPGCRPVMAAVSCRARAEYLGMAGSCRRDLLMGVQIAGKDIGTRFPGSRLRCGNCPAAARGGYRASPISKCLDAAAAVLPAPAPRSRLTARRRSVTSG